MAFILSVKNLNVELDGVSVLENVSFELEEGKNLAIIGPNGAGKTVLLKALLGALPYSGTVTWKSAVRLGYVPQKIDADRHLPLSFQNLYESKAAILGTARREIEETIATVGLEPRILATPVGHLSGGQFQKALIAFALLGKPNVLLLDEPTASIDRPGEEQFYELVRRLQEKYNLTVISVSHDLSFVYRYAAQVLCINKTPICFGSPDETLIAENLTKLYGTGFASYHHNHHPKNHDH